MAFIAMNSPNIKRKTYRHGKRSADLFPQTAWERAINARRSKNSQSRRITAFLSHRASPRITKTGSAFTGLGVNRLLLQYAGTPALSSQHANIFHRASPWPSGSGRAG